MIFLVWSAQSVREHDVGRPHPCDDEQREKDGHSSGIRHQRLSFPRSVRKEYRSGVPSHYSAETNGELSRRHLFRSVGTGYEEILGYAYVVGRCGRFTRK